MKQKVQLQGIHGQQWNIMLNMVNQGYIPPGHAAEAYFCQRRTLLIIQCNCEGSERKIMCYARVTATSIEFNGN